MIVQERPHLGHALANLECRIAHFGFPNRSGNFAMLAALAKFELLLQVGNSVMKRIWLAAIAVVLTAGAMNDASAMAYKDIAGQWCGEVSDYNFAPQILTVGFHNGTPAKVFKITKYTYTDEGVPIDWISSDGKELNTQFAEFADNGTMAQQKNDVGPRRPFK